jgi:archaellum component FlaC
MIHIKHEEVLKIIAQQEAVIISSGIMFLFIEGRTIKWKVASQKFDMDVFKVGMDVADTAIAVRAMKEKRILSEQVPRAKYGKRLTTVAIPLADDADETVGAFSIVLPKLHPVAESFPSFAPIITELFPEGAFLYMSDLTKIMYTQPSRKFTLPGMEVGYELKEKDMAYQCIHTGRSQSKEIGEERYGVPVYITTYPLFDEEDNGKQTIVATLGVVVPRATTGKLQGMSEKLSENIGSIAQTVELLAVNASSINENEQNLYNSIGTVNDILNQINKVTEFISSVAKQSNMLGLNASIEASRVGEAGRGFAVVATEIRKLAEESQETVPRIKKLTEDIQSKISEVNERCKKSIEASEEQASATEEISASIEELSTMTDELYLMSKNL